MSDSPDIPITTPVKQPHGKRQRTPSAAQGQGRRNNNNNRTRRHNPSASATQVDGTVSDSVTNASPRPKNIPGQKQSAAAGAYPPHNGYMGNSNGQKIRPVSMGGSMHLGTPAKEQAYAGPTFQASPAASALPVPKFLGSRSVPNAAPASSLQARMEGEKTPERVESSPESDVVSPVPPPRDAHQSPLDIFFMADKAEKEKRRSGSHGLSPEAAARPLPPTHKPTKPFTGSGQSMFAREMDGNGESIPSPKTIPYGQKPGLLERTSSSSPEAGAKVYDHSNGKHEASTQALKDLLFSNLNTSPVPKKSSTPVQTYQRANSNPQNPGADPETPSPFHRSVSGPSTPGQPSDQQSNYHYGNRNLSPMFNAVRAETPTRPSNLRQQLESPNQTNNLPPRPPYETDANAFSRSFLDQHLRSSLPNNASSGLISNNSSPPISDYSSAQHGVPIPSSIPPSGTSPRNVTNSSSRDIKGMEDDLRRMLKLNALG